MSSSFLLPPSSSDDDSTDPVRELKLERKQSEQDEKIRVTTEKLKNGKKVLASLRRRLGKQRQKTQGVVAELEKMHRIIAPDAVISRKETDKFYSMKKPKLGFALILNQLATDHGTSAADEDTDALCETFKIIMGDDPDIRCNCDTKAMEAVKSKILKMNYEDYNCFVMAIIAHGDTTDSFLLDSHTEDEDEVEYYSVDKLVEEICEVETLKGKPKLFFVDICRGDKPRASTSTGSTRDKGNDGSSDKKPKALTNCDLNHVFVGYSTLPQFKSYMGDDTSKTYMQYLAGFLLENYRALDFENIYHKVQQEMTEHVQGDGTVQPAEIRIRLPLKLHFGRFMEPILDVQHLCTIMTKVQPRYPVQKFAVMPVSGNVVIWGQTFETSTKPDPEFQKTCTKPETKFHLFNAAQEYKKTQTRSPLCDHIFDYFPTYYLLSLTESVLAVSCRKCQCIRVLDLVMTEEPVIGYHDSESHPSAMCHGADGDIYSVNVTGHLHRLSMDRILHLKYEHSQLAFVKSIEVNKSLRKEVVSVCYVPKPHSCLVLHTGYGIYSIAMAGTENWHNDNLQAGNQYMSKVVYCAEAKGLLAVNGTKGVFVYNLKDGTLRQRVELSSTVDGLCLYDGKMILFHFGEDKAQNPHNSQKCLCFSLYSVE